MSSINSVRKLQILSFSKKNKKIKNLKNGEKKWPDIDIHRYFWGERGGGGGGGKVREKRLHFVTRQLFCD